MAVNVVCLSPYSEELVAGFFEGREGIAIAIGPEPPAPEAIRELLAGADLVIGDMRHKHKLDRPVLSVMKRCKLIQMPSVGFDVVDHRAAAELGIAVANGAGYNRDAVADWTIMAILNLIRFGAYGDRRMREGGWPRPEMMGRELGALTVGIIGLGNVGSSVATRLRAFGSRILFTDIIPRSFSGAEQVPLDELLAGSDVVCVHTPLDHETRGFIDAAAFSAMKRGAILVNASRGPVVDEQALAASLDSGHLGGAALDVFDYEPLAADSPLRSMENVFLSPHVGGATRQAEQRIHETVRQNLNRVLDGLQPFNVVNGVTLAL